MRRVWKAKKNPLSNSAVGVRSTRTSLIDHHHAVLSHWMMTNGQGFIHPSMTLRNMYFSTITDNTTTEEEEKQVEEEEVNACLNKEEEDDDDFGRKLKPNEVVSQLNKYIVGQQDAKKAVAIALRNRWRRLKIPDELRPEVSPKNILMIGPTGCGKTEIARRLAKLSEAPFVKVEATKFTEVGFHGRDVDQIIRDLVENAIQMVKKHRQERVRKEVQHLVETRILNALVGQNASPSSRANFERLLKLGEME